jgi:hypothetical protein
MHIEPFPSQPKQVGFGVSVEGTQFDAMTDDDLVEMPHVPRAYENHEAKAVQRAYAGQTARITAANITAVWNGNLSKNLMRKLFVHSPPVHKPP